MAVAVVAVLSLFSNISPARGGVRVGFQPVYCQFRCIVCADVDGVGSQKGSIFAYRAASRVCDVDNQEKCRNAMTCSRPVKPSVQQYINEMSTTGIESLTVNVNNNSKSVILGWFGGGT